MLFVTSLWPAGERRIGDVLIGLPEDDIFFFYKNYLLDNKTESFVLIFH